MTVFDIASVLVGLAALFYYLNYRLLRLPSTIGVFSITLVCALLLTALDWLAPAWKIRGHVASFTSGIEFETLFMHGMLGLMLFAGALHVGVQELVANRWTIIALSTVGVVLSIALIGAGSWAVFHFLGIGVPVMLCLTFGAVVSPTDPIAVIGMLQRVQAPKDLEATIAGESLFNDGVGVVAFLALASFAGLGGDQHSTQPTLGFAAIAFILLRQAGGGVLLGFLAGHGAIRVLRSVDHRELELLITLALAMLVYTVSFQIGVSGPIAVVVAGLLIGHKGREVAMSPRTIEHVDAFWGMIDDILNAVLFLLMGLEVISTPLTFLTVIAAAAMIPVALGARYISVLIPVFFLRPWSRHPPGLVPILTWGGLRGGLSVAMALSLGGTPAKDLLIGCTYGIVVFAILAQGMTMEAVLRRFCKSPSPIA
ncbi:MAG TPA: sodium:proton antiporter [Acidobacteriaceae bacterium]